MPTIFTYVIGRKPALQTIEKYDVVAEESPTPDESISNITILEDSPEP